jgi:hypothetical protein
MSALAGKAPWALHDEVTDAYRLTLTNDSSVPAQVYTFTVLFYSGTGRELGNDGETLDHLTIIMPEQSFTWTETPWMEKQNGIFDTGSVPDIGVTCQLYDWSD